ncbi:MAG: histidine phosphatase family protein [Rickettsiales bacterium]
MTDDFPYGKTFYVMRHAKTNDNEKGMASGGKSQAYLVEEGKKQAKQAGDIIEKLRDKIDLVVTSEMQRTKDTAKISFDRDSLRNIKHIADAGINERDYGLGEGLSEKRRREFKELGGFVDGEESKDELRARVSYVVKRYLGESKSPLFVTHGGVVLRLIGIAIGGEKAVDELKKRGRLVNNCDIYEFKTPEKKNGKWQVNLITLDKDRNILRLPLV